MLRGIGVAAMIVLAGAAARAQPVGAAGPPPVEGGGPIEVGIGFHIADFGRITAREETFDVTAHLELHWRDPRLAGGKRPEGKLWVPLIYFDNAAEAPKPHAEPDIDVDEDGRVVYRTNLSGRFSTPLDLRKFPFDDQDLVVRISLADDLTEARLVPLPECMTMHDDAFLTDWEVVDQTFRVASRRYRAGGREHAMLEYRVRVDRRSTFYAWRVLLPLTLLSLIPALVFWFEPVNLQPQISTCMGTLIAMLAFGYSVDFALPKVAYLTMIDRHALIGFLFAATATIGVAVVHRAVTAGSIPNALKIQRRLRVLYPAAYVIVVGASLAELLAR